MPNIVINGTLYTKDGEGIDYSVVTFKDSNNCNIIGVGWAEDKIISNPTPVDPCIAIEAMSNEIGGEFCQSLARFVLADAFWDVKDVTVKFVAQDMGYEKQFVIITINDYDLCCRLLVLNLDGSIKIERINPSEEEKEILLCNNKFLLSKL